MAELRLDIFQEEQEALKHPGVWEDVLRMTRTGKMPPPGSPMSSTEAIEALASWIESRRESMLSGLKLLPGRVTARRLNRVEYNNSIRDLLGVDLQPADTFPVDDSGYGFDNIGDVLSLSSPVNGKIPRRSRQDRTYHHLGQAQVRQTDPIPDPGHSGCFQPGSYRGCSSLHG